SIEYQASSISPEKATISDITARLDDKNLCNVRVKGVNHFIKKKS
ncbi:hypothetical protein D1BOALGB6SA_10935, partial [Olavius sp. associated proteobacterium Delta 1]